MKKINFIKFLYFLFLLIFIIPIYSSKAEIIENIIIKGNDRISNESIKMFSEIDVGENITNVKLNIILKNLYDTNFFSNVSVNLLAKDLIINVTENPIIEKVEFKGIKSQKIRDALYDIINLKSRSSYSDYIVSNDRKIIKSFLKDIGYYFANVDTVIVNLENNLVKIDHVIELGEKAKIKKISFIGDKIFKEKKLRNIIVSEEYKFWKFLSGKKFLNQQTINLDQRLLKNFYLNKGFYNVEINATFAKLIGNQEFELIFNINPKEKIFFNNLSINIPTDFNVSNFNDLNNLFADLKGEPYSINMVEKILDQLDFVTLNEEFKSIKSSINESLNDNKLNIVFNIEETEKYFVEKINIFGNNITRESVIRNNLEIDEGDPFNEILQNRSENNLKSLNFFKTVSSEVTDGKNETSKIINIIVEEKPTGEISAGAGFGTSGGTFQVGVKENNYLGKGLTVNSFISLSPESIKGRFSLTDPNFKNSDKSLYTALEAIEIDRMGTNGYKTNKTGFDIGTKFEYYDDFFLGFSTSSYYEKIETDSTASARQQSQEGNYWDTFLSANFDYDKRNQKYRPDQGFRSNFNISLPVISDTNTLTNKYNYQKFSSLYENNRSIISLYIATANSIGDEDIKLTERLFLPSSKLRGFERGKVGPKDGNDFIGGNFAAAINTSSTLPVLFEESQNIDANIFFDIANIWGVDYNSSLADSDKIRSSIGIGIDWFTPLGPLTFSLSETLTKASTDIEESFRFNIGTTF